MPYNLRVKRDRTLADREKKKTSLTIKIALALALGAVVAVGLLAYAGLGETVDALRCFNWVVLPAVLACACGNYLVRFCKWHYYCRTLSIPVRRADSLVIFMSGMSMSISPGKLGEVLKSFLLKKVTGTPVTYSAPIVVAERLTDLVGLLILSAAGMLLVSFEGWMETARWVLAGCAIGVLALVAAMTSRRFAGAFLGVMGRLPLAGRFAGKAGTLFESAEKLLRPAPLVIASVVSAASWGFECVGFIIVLHAFGVTSVPVATAVLVYCVGTIVGAISMLPGGLGLTEICILGPLVRFGIPKPGATAVTFIIRACTLWFGTLLGTLFLVVGRKRFNVELAEIEENAVDGSA